MPALVAVLWGGLLNILGTLVGRIIAAIGVGVVTYTGVSSSLDWLKTQAVSSLHMLDPQVVGLLGVLKVGVFISIISSAVMARLLLSGLQSGTFKRWVTK